MVLPKLIDNIKKSFVDALKSEAPKHKHLSIATGYWDLAGTKLLIDELQNYESIRLIIGQEPLSKIHPKSLDDFPETQIKEDLETAADDERETASKIHELIDKKILQVKVFKQPFLHAKTFIFGDYESSEPVAFIGSSNWTAKGLTKNIELNTPLLDPMIVKYSGEDQYGPLSWFDAMWNHENIKEWSGEFSNIVSRSPVGDMTYGPYDVYIKTLMEVFPEELEEDPVEPLDILYDFQNRNAGLLIKKLERIGVAMLSDSVGLGKTITAGRVMKHYLDKDDANIKLIVPAALKQQWEDDLSKHLGINRYNPSNYQLISMQDTNKIESVIDQFKNYKKRNKPVDLFVFDEAHNLRRTGGQRYELILQLLKQHPKAKVLLLTATPINNSLIDFANQIQLGSKGSLKSVSVPFPNDGHSEPIDFFEALRQIQSRYKQSQNKGVNFDWNKFKSTIAAGLRYYLVRTTRKGVAEEHTFPKTKVQNLSYDYKGQVEFDNQIFGNLDVKKLDINKLTEITQVTQHPLDAELPFMEEELNSVIGNIFQGILTLGFPVYRPLLYKQDYYKKKIEDVNKLLKDDANGKKIRSQMAIHNILHVSWLKRLESSGYALTKSLEYYSKRLDKFAEWLDKGYIMSLSDIEVLENEYGGDIDKGEQDYQKYLDEWQADDSVKKFGIEVTKVDDTFEIDALKNDIDRDRRIVEHLTKTIRQINSPKLEAFKEFIKNIDTTKYGKKILVFSFFADTIKYLEQELSDGSPDKAFISGLTGNKESNSIVDRFSPKSKNYKLKDGETEINFLCSTDVLSEGQNLQDSGVLINYDLHWNPVRMIQRNGRINRLGSEYEEVLISNAIPHTDLELYLQLVKTLENKINVINETIGLDQDVFKQDEAKPKEFIEDLYSEDSGTATKAAEELDEEESILDWTDEFQTELRRFMKTASEEDKKRIESIPVGKWNYLPNRNMNLSLVPQGAGNNENTTVLALQKLMVQSTNSDFSFPQTCFIKLSPNTEVKGFGGLGANIKGEFLETPFALNYIKCEPTNNAGQKDKITLDRSSFKKQAEVVAKTKVEENTDLFKLKPTHEKALNKMNDYFDKSAELLLTFMHGITSSDEEKRFNKLCRQINHDDIVSAYTIDKFEDLYNEIKSKADEDKVVEDQESILFYVSDES